MVFGIANNRDDVPRETPHIFTIHENGNLNSYEGVGGEVPIPEVTRRIGDEAFVFCDHVTSVIIPEGVQEIAEKAFYRSGVRSVLLPGTLKRIGKNAFTGTPLERVEIPDSVTDIGEGAFSGAARLKSVKLSENIKRIEPSVFKDCVSLKEIVLPESVMHVEGRAFMNCSALERVDFPAKLVSVWTSAFEGCTALKEVYLGDKVEAIGADAFKDCAALERVRIPAKLEMSPGNSFWGAPRLILSGPGTVDGLIISERVLKFCSPGLKKVVVPEGVVEIETPALNQVTRLEELHLPRSLKYYDWRAFAFLRDLKRIVSDRNALAGEIGLLLDIPCFDRAGQPMTYQTPNRKGKWLTKPDAEHGGLTLMGLEGRIGHTGLAGFTTVILPDAIAGVPVTSIGAHAFDGFGSADAFYIPDSVKRIESHAFSNSRICQQGDALFIRMPKDVIAAEDAFENSKVLLKGRWLEGGSEPNMAETQNMVKPAAIEDTEDSNAARAADDAANGTGIAGRPNLTSNVWRFFDKLSREERIQELTHRFWVNGRIDGVGWATIKIFLDGDSTRFRISYIGASPRDFIKFVAQIADGDDETFGWSSEPGWYPWTIQRRGGVFYVNPPQLGENFFIAREDFLAALFGLRGDWEQ